MHKADGNNVWSIMTYMKPQRGTTIPTIDHDGVTADTLEEKTDMLLGISIPRPIDYRIISDISPAPDAVSVYTSYFRDKRNIKRGPCA